MDINLKYIVSMLVSDKKTTLFTEAGEVIDITADGSYDTAKISEYLTPKLTGMTAVGINLCEFLTITNMLDESLAADYENEGIVIVQVIDGKKVQGIFYPEKIAVTVKLSDGNVVTIPDIDNLSEHMKRASDDKSPSVINFLKRLALVIKERKHSGEDLMKFIKRSEMPLTNSGRIIAYKRVKAGTDPFYVDCHSGKILQRVGSRVSMDVDMVDESRSNSCSTGLHVANLDYLSGFHGSHTLIVLVDPENFIAVPYGEDTKARVCSYDIIGVMGNHSHKLVSQGHHVSNDTTLEQLVSSAIKGTAIAPFEEILVGRNEILSIKKIPKNAISGITARSFQASGTSLRDTKKKSAVSVIKQTRSRKQGITASLPQEVIEAFKMIILNVPKALIAKNLSTSSRSIGRWIDKYDFESFKAEVTQPKKDSKPMTTTIKTPTIADQARKLFRMNHLAKLRIYKSEKKRSWSALGFSSTEQSRIMANA